MLCKSRGQLLQQTGNAPRLQQPFQQLQVPVSWDVVHKADQPA